MLKHEIKRKVSAASAVLCYASVYEGSGSVFCTNCGAPIGEGNDFCTACGAPAVPVTPPAAAPVSGVYMASAAATSKPEMPVPASEPAPTISHLKINMPGAETAPVVTPRPVKTESSVASGFFSAAGNLGAETGEPAKPAVTSPTMVSAPSYAPASFAATAPAPSYPSAPAYPASPTYPTTPAYPSAASYTSHPGETAVLDSGGFRDSEPETTVPPVMHYTVNPYERYSEEEASPTPVKRKRKKWPLVLAIVLAALIAAAAAAWFFIPGVQDAILGKQELSFKEDTLTLKVDDKTDLNELLVLNRVDENKVRWESSDTDHKIIRCRDGKITAIGAGTCEIKVFLAENEDVSATIEINVIDPNAPDGQEQSSTEGNDTDSEQSNEN